MIQLDMVHRMTALDADDLEDSGGGSDSWSVAGDSPRKDSGESV